MASNYLSSTNYPTEIVTVVMVNAARDAHHVSLFLEALGLSATPEKPRPMPGGFLLHLAAALRLLAWETQSFFFHRAAGLPEARQAIRDAFQSLTDPDADPTELCVAVLRLSIERFAWTAQRDLGADVALHGLIEETALDALAEFLWASRHAGPVAGSPQP